MSEQRPPLEEQIRKTLDDSVADLPAEVRSKLTQARHRALDQARRKPRATLPWLIPAGGVAAGLLAAVLWQSTTAPELPDPSLAALDLELLLTDESFEMVEELEFLIWLDEQNDAG